MTDDQVRAARMRSQWLDGRATDVAELVRHMVGIQAQEPRAGALSIRARTDGVTAGDVARAIEERRIVRTWAMRGTIHFVAAEDLGWLHNLFAPALLPRQHAALEKLGVAERNRARAVETLVGALREGPLTRAELSEHLERAGIATEGQRAAYFPRLAALEGHVCFGPPRDGKDTYALAGDLIAGGRRPDEPLRELARRYTDAYAPATVRDMAAWSGLPLSSLKPVFEEVDGGLAKPPDPPVVRLLPAFDTYLLGYSGRDLAVPAAHAKKVWPGGGIVRPAIVENGLAVGTWSRSGARIAIEPFEREPDVAEEIADVERFLSR